MVILEPCNISFSETVFLNFLKGWSHQKLGNAMH